MITRESRLNTFKPESETPPPFNGDEAPF